MKKNKAIKNIRKSLYPQEIYLVLIMFLINVITLFIFKKSLEKVFLYNFYRLRK